MAFFFLILFAFFKKTVFWLSHIACGILVLQQGIELTSLALKALGLNHWTVREVPASFYLFIYFLSLPSLLFTAMPRSSLSVLTSHWEERRSALLHHVPHPVFSDLSDSSQLLCPWKLPGKNTKQVAISCSWGSS